MVIISSESASKGSFIPPLRMKMIQTQILFSDLNLNFDKNKEVDVLGHFVLTWSWHDSRGLTLHRL